MNPLERLVQAFKALPGVGPRAAQRLAFHVLQHDKPAALELGESLLHALNHIQHCSQCNTFTHLDVCELCADPKRDARLLCVVETPADLWAIEQTQTYRGYYYVLMGKASPLDGTQPKALAWPRLAARVENGMVQEVILATNFTNEGEATAAFLTEQLKRLNIVVSRLARGVPIGAELEYTDPLTVARAMADRR